MKSLPRAMPLGVLGVMKNCFKWLYKHIDWKWKYYLIVGRLSFLGCLDGRTMELSLLVLLELWVQSVIALTLHLRTKRSLRYKKITMTERISDRQVNLSLETVSRDLQWMPEDTNSIRYCAWQNVFWERDCGWFGCYVNIMEYLIQTFLGCH